MPTTHFPAACPRCETGLRVRREYLGQWVSCRYCGQVFEATEVHGHGGAPVAKRPGEHPFESSRNHFTRYSPVGPDGQSLEAVPHEAAESLREARDAASSRR